MAAPPRSATAGGAQPIRIEPEGLDALIGLPERARAIVVFAHGSGSGRFSTRNNYVAGALREAGLGTLLLDLLRPEEEADRANVFNIDLLAARLSLASEWVEHNPATASLPVCYFGASTGAAAALKAAAFAESRIAAIVSRGGRPDLAMDELPMVRAPTLLIVGGLDTAVIELNRLALGALRGDKDLAIVPGAGHLFEEPGALDAVVRHATDWFLRHVPAGEQSSDVRP